MAKRSELLALNAVLFLSFTVQAVAGLWMFFLRYVEAIEEIHKYNGLLFIALALLHLYMNRSWVSAQLRARGQGR